ncbi:acyl-CoA dehydratase activase [Methanoregula sp.]|uniref:acyl-CoA dehydratase activase n=1 Tax=Methanoregula sp. TaxID=2052170 RepID=UPI000CC42AE5|nr:acyl-CoA dehydratase activase [Methanoregula sp.]PKG31649.1 MAG: 2-hydroxyglutaryl-CoA dehydratase [Methanoregula sp.]
MHQDDSRRNDAGTVAGIDLGSTQIKAVIYNGSSYVAGMTDASWDVEATALALLLKTSSDAGLSAPPKIIATTGYGRRCLKIATLTCTEIAAHAKGAFHLVPGCQFVIDIGGQDAKGIRLSAEGYVEDFVMNDKCAAGTGRFLSNMGRALGVPVEQFGSPASRAEPHRINAMCTVFAESEVISLLHQGVSRDAIIAGLHASIARRTVSMVAALNPEFPVVFTEGVAHNSDITQRIS